MYIYKIENTVTKKVYIGSAKDYGKRWEQHKRMLLKNKHHSVKLQNSYNYYGHSCFEYTLLEDLTGKVTRDELYEVEYEIIKQYDSVKKGYNCKAEGYERNSYKPTPKILKDISNNRDLCDRYFDMLKDLLSGAQSLPNLKYPVIIKGFNLESKSTPLKRIFASIDVLLDVVSDLTKLKDYEGYLKVSHINYLHGTYDYFINDKVPVRKDGTPSKDYCEGQEVKLHFVDKLVSQWLEELLSCDNGQAIYEIFSEKGLDFSRWLPDNVNLLKEEAFEKYLLEEGKVLVEVEDLVGDCAESLNLITTVQDDVSGKVKWDRSALKRNLKPFKELLYKNNLYLREGKYYTLKTF